MPQFFFLILLLEKELIRALATNIAKYRLPYSHVIANLLKKSDIKFTHFENISRKLKNVSSTTSNGDIKMYNYILCKFTATPLESF